VPLVLDHAEGDEQHEEVDGIEAREAGQPELTLDEGLRTVGVVIGEDVARDEEEDAYEDVAVVDDGIEQTEVWGGEVEEDDEDSEQGTNTGESWQGRLADSDCKGSRLFDLWCQKTRVHTLVLLEVE
jgi:hypothetical protein